MIYLFAGEDTLNKRKAYEIFLKSVAKNAEIFQISRNNFDRGQIESLYSGSGLFFSKSVTIFSDILEREESGEFILEKLPFMADSKNAFIFLESKLNKSVLDAFRKSRAEINVFEIPKERKERFNTFLLANDFGSRDKLNLWIHFRQALQAEVSLEEMTGVLFWKVKDMILKKSFGKFSEAELKNFLSQISTLLPKSRGEGKDAEAALEQFLLEAF